MLGIVDKKKRTNQNRAWFINRDHVGNLSTETTEMPKDSGRIV